MIVEEIYAIIAKFNIWENIVKYVPVLMSSFYEINDVNNYPKNQQAKSNKTHHPCYNLQYS